MKTKTTIITYPKVIIEIPEKEALKLLGIEDNGEDVNFISYYDGENSFLRVSRGLERRKSISQYQEYTNEQGEIIGEWKFIKEEKIEEVTN